VVVVQDNPEVRVVVLLLWEVVWALVQQELQVKEILAVIVIMHQVVMVVAVEVVVLEVLELMLIQDRAIEQMVV
jgi:hypothetical protein